MTGRRDVGRAICGLSLAALLTLCGALAGVPAAAFEPLSGNKNFTTPSSVPNYFSNEGAPFGRVSQTAQPGADRFNTATRPIPVQTAVPTPASVAATGAGHASTRGGVSRGGTGRTAHAASRTSRARHAGKARARSAPTALSTRAASRPSVSAKQRSAAKNRPRYAERGSGRAGRSIR